jgi:hypothetical protein
MWATGPVVSRLGSTWPEWKKFLRPVLFSEKLLQGVKTCKMHRKISIHRKNAYDTSKCSEKHDLYFGITIMHC